jgi:hypothetical protein
MSPHSGSFVQTPQAMTAANGVLKTVSDFKSSATPTLLTNDNPIT